jgi:hypothetical protein
MAGRYAEYREAVAQVTGEVVTRALQPAPRVARHWASMEKLSWFGAAADHHLVHVSWSFGHLRDLPRLPGKRHTVGVFAVTKATFGVDEVALRTRLEQLIPEGTDGATRVFLQRVTAQLATADALLALPDRLGCEVSLFARTDAVDTPAATPRWPEHARERVELALSKMDPELKARCERVWAAPAEVLLAACLV